jgi:hypothetical protein
MRYRESGQMRLKYIAAAPNLSDAYIAGFIQLTKRVNPVSVMVTPEYGASFTKQYGAANIDQIAKLINGLRGTGLPIVPDNPIDGARIFPDFWPALATQLKFQKRPEPGFQVVGQGTDNVVPSLELKADKD